MRHSPAGVSLIEVMLVAAIIAIALSSLTLATMTSMTNTRQSQERAAALSAARAKLEEIKRAGFNDIIALYGTSGTAGRTFQVPVERMADGRIINLRGLNNQPAAEIVIINHESLSPASYGRDLLPANGQPDGVTFRGLPMDLNGDMNTTSGSITNLNATRLPVGIVVRWQGSRGPERYELWTVISRY